MMDLAEQEENGHQQRHNIAQRQHIPLDFMDQITSRLRAAGLVHSIRGRSGGFELAKPTNDISLWDIFQAVEDSLYPVKCLEDEMCDLEASCISFGIWEEVFTVMRQALKEKTLAQSVRKWRMQPLKEIPFVEGSNYGTCNRPNSSKSTSNTEINI